MEEKVVKLMKEKPLFIPKVLLNNYRGLGITDEEFVILIALINDGEKIEYNPELLANEIKTSKKDIMKIINSLCDKNIISLVIEKHGQKASEYLSLDLLYDKLFNTIIDTKESKEIDTSVFSVFENELGRTLSPMEYEKIKEWINSGYTNELITCALCEAVLNGVNNLNYIDKILLNWGKKGYKTKADVAKDKEAFQEKKEKVDVYYTDWLNE